jgi:hypothetical protein
MVSYFLIGFSIMLIFTFVMGLNDEAYKVKYYEGIWYKDIFNFFKYYALWILPYWWLLILIGSIVMTILFSGIDLIIKRFK